MVAHLSHIPPAFSHIHGSFLTATWPLLGIKPSRWRRQIVDMQPSDGRRSYETDITLALVEGIPPIDPCWCVQFVSAFVTCIRHTHTHTHTHTRTHARTHARTHTHTHTKKTKKNRGVPHNWYQQLYFKQTFYWPKTNQKNRSNCIEFLSQDTSSKQREEDCLDDPQFCQLIWLKNKKKIKLFEKNVSPTPTPKRNNTGGRVCICYIM